MEANLPAEVQSFHATDGYEFYYRRWKPTGKPRGRLVFVHGIRSHGGWYGRSCAEFASAGFDVFFLDRRGSGLNTAHRGDTPSFRRLLDDLAEFLLHLRREKPWLPTFLGGISWGGKLAVGLQYRRPGLVDGIVLLAPGLKPLIQPPIALRARLPLAAIVNPTRKFPIPLNEPDLFTADVGWQKFIDSDRFGLREATARFLFASFALDVYLRRAKRRVRVPSLLLLAGKDRVIDNAKTRKFVLGFPSRFNSVIEYPESHHTLEFEPTGHPFMTDVTTWMARVTRFRM